MEKFFVVQLGLDVAFQAVGGFHGIDFARGGPPGQLLDAVVVRLQPACGLEIFRIGRCFPPRLRRDFGPRDGEFRRLIVDAFDLLASVRSTEIGWDFHFPA